MRDLSSASHVNTTASASTTRRDDPYGAIVAAARDATSISAFYEAALRAIGRRFASPYATIYVRLRSEIVQSDFHCGPTDPNFWKPTVQAFLTEGLAEPRSRAKLLAARNAKLRIALLSVPLHAPDGDTIGALALVTSADGADVRRSAALLESLCALTSYVAGFVGRRSAASEAPAAPNQALTRAATVESVEELAFAITNNLRNKLACDHVALATVTGSHVKILSISGMDEVNKRSPGVVLLRSAMEECLDAGEPIRYDADHAADSAARKYLLHKRWHEAAHGAAVASIPLRVGERIAAIISLRRNGNDPFDNEKIEKIRSVVEPFAAALELVRDARRGVVRHVRDAARETAVSFVRPGSLGRKLSAAAMLLAALWFVFGKMDYSVPAPCVLQPKTMRHVTMPFEGVLASASAVAGDEVRAGDVLCVIDHRDLELRRRELLASLEVAKAEQIAALAGDDRVEAKLAQARITLLRAQLATVERRIEMATVRSPFDGRVVAGDLRQRIGGVLKQGEPLFQVAPLHAWTLEIAAPEWAADDLQAGFTGHFASNARPENAQPLRVSRVRPSAEVRDGDNVYIAEAEVETDAPWMRPGMEGLARVYVGRRPVWWVTLHKVLDQLRLNFWL
ncbi:MAG: HlyD family efflux transporter periplasmic adaptor subunit [Planctomycetota bacterium]|nr:MAG: HlyD family efflux transporter periplasmic adaptor subunit [Planctomycetota bacterium]